MNHGAVHLIEYLVEDVFARQQRADRNMAAGQRLRQQHHVGFDVPVLAGEKPSGAADAGLNFVGDQQRSIAAAQRGRARQKFIRRHVDAFALDRLDDKGGNLARRQHLLQRCEIVEGDGRAIRQQRSEAGAEVGIAGQRQRAIGQSVERVIAVHDARPPGCAACEFDRSFDTFRARIRKKDFIEIRHVSEQPLREHARQRGNVQLHEIRQIAVEHALQSVTKYRMVPPNRKNAKTAE